MLNSYFKILFTFVIAISIFLTGCNSDNSVTPPTTTTVNGKIVDSKGAGVGGVSIWIDSNIATSNFDGTFSISNIEAPYNVKVVFDYSSNSYGYLFEDVSTHTPVLTVDKPGNPLQGTFNITIPPMVANQRASVFAVTDNVFENAVQVPFPSTNAILGAEWVSGNEVNAKIVVLVYTMSGGNIVSYEKYGEKDTTITAGSTINYTFTNSELSLDPGEATIAGNIVLPGGYLNPQANMILSFSQASTWSAISMGNQVMSNAFNFTVPTGLTTTPKIGVSASGSTNDGHFSSNNFVLLAGSTNNTLNVNAAPNLGSPLANATGINLSTDFSYSGGSGTGMYKVRLNTVGKIFYIITNNTAFRIPDFSQFGLNYVAGENYTWYLFKYHSIGSVNDYVSISELTNSSYTGNSLSNGRSFTSGN